MLRGLKCEVYGLGGAMGRVEWGKKSPPPFRERNKFDM